MGEAAVTPPAWLTLVLPEQMMPQSVPLYASNTLSIRDRAKVFGKTIGSSGVVNAGGVRTELGVEANVGSVWSNAPVTVAARARVEGNLNSAGSVTLAADATVTGITRANTPLETARASTFQPQIPPRTFGSYDVQPDQTVQLAPGGYGSLSVKSRATVHLRSGTYWFESLGLEPQAKLVVDETTAPVIVYVRDGVTHRGQVIEKANASSNDVDLLIIAYGTMPAFVEAPFKGTIFVPNAALMLQPLNGGQHFGAFFSRDLTVEAGVIVRHHPFPWGSVLPPTPVIIADAPVQLRPTLGDDSGGSGGGGGTSGDSGATGGGAGSGTTGGSGGAGGASGSGGSGAGGRVATVKLPGPVTFRIPTEIWTTTGNAGRGKVEFTFGTGSQVPKVCTYTGGSSTDTPTTDLELAKGRRYLFPSCTPGDTATGDTFSLEVESAATNQEATSVELHLGGGCSGSLPAPMAPEEVVVLRDNFNWRTTAALAETDPDGRPASWHGMIYIDREEQLQALDRWNVYWSALPLSETYAKDHAGQCGRVLHASEGKGLVVYAIFPAELFNILRTFSIEAILKSKEPPFRFIVPTPPDTPEHLNADGSLRYSALASAGFGQWLAARPPQLPLSLGGLVNKVGNSFKDAVEWVDDNIIDPAGAVADTGFSYVSSGWDAAVDWTATAVDNTFEEIQERMGDFLGLVADEATVEVTFRMLNRDPLFNFPFGPKTDMIRAWGPNVGTTNARPKIFPRGTSLIVRQWGFGFIPVLNRTRLGAGGTATLRTLEGAPARTLGFSGDGLCIELENDEAMFTSDFAANEVCDFVDGEAFKHDGRVNIETDHADLHAMTQIVDSADYARTVIGWDPARVDVLTGWAANTITGLLGDPLPTISPFAEGHGPAMTLCLDYPFDGPATISYLNTQVGETVASALAAPLLLKDMWWPDVVNVVNSRGIMTHEYGHFLMCDMLFSAGNRQSPPAGATWLSPLSLRVLDGEATSRTDEVALVTESWADTFTMQVTGGSNYIVSDGATPQDPGNVMAFCRTPLPGAPAACMDWNYQGQDDYLYDPSDPDKFDFLDELAEVESTIHDAFDRSDSSARLTNSPWNGDVWQRDFGGQPALTFSVSPYLAFSDEPVFLVGSSWKDWVDGWAARGGLAKREHYFGGLSYPMERQLFNWCQRCEVFAVHEFLEKDGSGNNTGNPAFYAPSSFSDHIERWKICQGFEAITTWLGSGPPEPFLNIDSSCTACPGLHFSAGGVCTPCPSGEVPRGDDCDPCPPGSVPQGATNTCSACGAYEITDGTSCVPCPIGYVADRSSNTCTPCPADLTVDIGTYAGCESRSYVTGVPGSPADTCPLDYWVDVINMQTMGECVAVFIDARVGGLGETECPSHSGTLEIFDPANRQLFLGSGAATWALSPPPPSCRFPSQSAIAAAQVDAGLTRVRFRVGGSKLVLGSPQPVPMELTVGLVSPVD